MVRIGIALNCKKEGGGEGVLGGGCSVKHGTGFF